jgi:uncharacterized protein (TIGR02145 family)
VEAGTVTVHVSWRNTGRPAVWSDTVWVWADHVQGGKMVRLPLSGATLTAPSWAAASVTFDAGNTSGAWVVGNARGSGTFSTTVKLYYTTPLDVAGACAYASNYPPVGRYASAEDIVFTGTPPYEVVVEDAVGYPRTLQSGSTFMVPAGRVVTSFSDKTGAPGACIPMQGTLGFTVAPSELMKDAPATFTAAVSLTAPAAFAITHHWSAPGFGTTAGTGSSFSATAPAVAGAHTVTLTAKAAGHCDKVVEQSVTVQNCGTLSPPTVASANSRCGGGTVTFSATPPSGCTIDWYTTSSGGSIVPGGAGTASFSPTITGTTTYYAQARHTTTGCVSATRTPVTAAVGTVPATPTITLSASTVCQHASLIAYVDSPLTSNATYTWVASPGTQTGSSYAFNTATAGAKTATVFVQVTAGGVTCRSFGPPTVTANVQALPADPTAPSQDGPKCAGTAVTFSATVPSGATGLDWTGSVSGTGASKTTATTAGTYSAQVRAYLTSGAITCYSQWTSTVSGIVRGTSPNAQVNFTAFDPCPNAAVGSAWYLKDSREPDGEPMYKVMKLADGRIWMVNDLRFGNQCGIAFAGSTGRDQTGHVSSTGTYYGDCTAATYSTTPPERGYLYDWAAAINKSGAYGGNMIDVGCYGTSAGYGPAAPATCQGLCPVGWHLPTGDNTGEYKALSDATSACSTGSLACWVDVTAWRGVLGGFAMGNALARSGEVGTYWSSTFASEMNGWSLGFSTTDVHPGTLGAPKSYGMSVRCVMNY